MSAGSRMARWAAGRGHPPGRAAVVPRQSWLPEDDVRPAGGGPDDPVPAAQRAAGGLLAQSGMALAGRAGARLAAAAGIAVHRSTLQGLVAAQSEPEISTAPEVAQDGRSRFAQGARLRDRAGRYRHGEGDRRAG